MYDSCIVIPGIACVHESCKLSGELCGPFSGLILHKNAMLGPESDSSLNFQGNLQCDLGNTSYFKENHSSTSQKQNQSKSATVCTVCAHRVPFQWSYRAITVQFADCCMSIVKPITVGVDLITIATRLSLPFAPLAARLSSKLDYNDIVEAHCYFVDIGRIDREQIRSRINNNDVLQSLLLILLRICSRSIRPLDYNVTVYNTGDACYVLGTIQVLWFPCP